jgi:hypothetical protein
MALGMNRLLTVSVALAAAGCNGGTLLFDLETDTDLAA